ncbi:MAG: hypothetical protein ONB44_16835 [candidate division KSB1 bacterium]|nr:hypothetical protein [candidate division KSB1 bacterium]MDZ7313061.1 hypothetical protein [candidate division KSB1 bacterium]
MKRLFLFFLTTFLFIAASLGQTYTPNSASRNDKYRPGDWVSYGVARYIGSVAVGTQYAYFGSTEGILRYDIFRNRWEAPYTTSDGLADNQILAVAYDGTTGVLFCSTPAGISSQHPSSLRWTNFSKAEIGIAVNDEVVSIGVGRRSVWFETRSRQTFKQDKLGSVIVPASGAELEAQITWSGARVQRPNWYPHFFVPAGYVFDPNGVIQDYRLRRAEVTGMVRDPWDSFWLGTWGLGAWRANVYVERAELLAFGLAQRRVDALAFDERGLWIGGKNDQFDLTEADMRGITYWRNPSTGSASAGDWRYYEARFNMDMSSDEVNRFTIADGKIYCATEYGINIYDPPKDRWRHIVSTDHLLSERINDVLVYDDFLWAATDLGLNRIKLSTVGKDSLEVANILPDQLLHIAVYDLERTENLLWIATRHGPFIYDLARGSGGFLSDNLGPRDEPIRAISHCDSLIWFGTSYGVEVFDTKNKVWLPAPARQRWPNVNINYLLARPEAVWAGTDAGVFKYDRLRKDWRQFTVEDGLIDNRVNAIAVKGDWIWFGTPSGLTAFHWNDPHRID